QLVELRLFLSPVERRGPLGQFFHLQELRTAVALALNGRRPYRSLEALAQIVQLRLGNGDGVRRDGRHDGPPCFEPHSTRTPSCALEEKRQSATLMAHASR